MGPEGIASYFMRGGRISTVGLIVCGQRSDALSVCLSVRLVAWLVAISHPFPRPTRLAFSISSYFAGFLRQDTGDCGGCGARRLAPFLCLYTRPFLFVAAVRIASVPNAVHLIASSHAIHILILHFLPPGYIAASTLLWPEHGPVKNENHPVTLANLFQRIHCYLFCPRPSNPLWPISVTET